MALVTAGKLTQAIAAAYGDITAISPFSTGLDGELVAIAWSSDAGTTKDYLHRITYRLETTSLTVEVLGEFDRS